MTSSSPAALFEASGVRKDFGGVVAVDVDRIDIARGTLVSLIGPNGAGKTTFFDVVTGFQAAKSGTVRFDGEAISGWEPYKIARRGLVRTFQLTRVLARMTVIDNMRLAADDQPGERLYGQLIPGAVRRQEQEITDRADELLERFSLTHVRDEYAGRLSGGQKKLLELARALMVRPQMMLLDEPMAGVNPALGEALLHYVEELRDEGMTFLLVEHDMDVVMRISERVIVMAAGRVIADGTPQEVRGDQRVVDAYLGEHAAEQIAAAEAHAQEDHRE
ncbi:MAG: ABC transporter ATP-binding protein [Acidimicrobiia bacterium]|nr:ABC transporter ATP-binding protein [Acidimicrobiia bacterium]